MGWVYNRLGRIIEFALLTLLHHKPKHPTVTPGESQHLSRSAILASQKIRISWSSICECKLTFMDMNTHTWQINPTHLQQTIHFWPASGSDIKLVTFPQTISGFFCIYFFTHFSRRFYPKRLTLHSMVVSTIVQWSFNKHKKYKSLHSYSDLASDENRRPQLTSTGRPSSTRVVMNVRPLTFMPNLSAVTWRSINLQSR